MRRIVLGLVIVLHALAHANVVIWAAPLGWFATLLWSVALIGYLSAGLGMLRVPIVRHAWKQLMVTATIASMVLLLLMGELIASLGAIIDLLLLMLAFEWAQRRVDADVVVADAVGAEGLGHPWMHRVAWTVGAAFLVYATLVVAIRPTYVRWGTSSADRLVRLPGDQLVSGARYRVDHAITINAPADSVWPWVAQIGQDRAGFYSYAWLERLAGSRITNADRIHPEWQEIKAGDFVRATQPDYLGGRLGEPGWRVLEVVPGRAMVLENWGAFVVRPIDSATTRFQVRTRAPGAASLLGIMFGPLNVFVFEPAHFIMERGMMRGVRDRAERDAPRAG